MAKELWLSPFGTGLAAAIPANYPADTAFAFYWATDTATLYVATKTADGVAPSWISAGGTPTVGITDAATYTFLAANSGKLHIAPNLTADAVWTLPAPTAGLHFSIIYGGVAADAQDWLIDTGADANFYLGGIVHLDNDAVAAGIEVVVVAPDGNSNSKLTVTTPTAGTRLDLYADGTHWYLNGFVVSIAAPAFADQ